MKKIIACMFAFTLLLTGCGSSDDEKNIDKNTGREQLIVAMDCNSAPYSYLVDHQNDNTVAFGKSLYASGYDVLFARDLAKSMNKELVIKKMSSAKMSEAIANGDVDIAMGGLMKDTKNEDVEYSNVYYESDLALIVRKDGKYADKTELKQFKNAKVQGLKDTFMDHAIDQIKGVKHQKGAASYGDLITQLKNKKVDAITAEANVAAQIVKQQDAFMVVSFKEKKGFTSGKGVVIAMKEESDLKNKINTFIKKMKDEKKKEYMDTANANVPSFIIETKEKKK